MPLIVLHSYENRYSIRVRARGETARGNPFERERTLTAVAVPGGDRWSPNDPQTNDLCELLHCLQEQGTISGELAQKLKELGIDLPTFLKCLGERCRSTSAKLETRQPQKPHDLTQLAGISLDQLVEVIAERMGERLS